MTKIVIMGELTDLNSYINAERSNRHEAARIKKDNTNLCLWQVKGLKLKIERPVDIVFTWYTKDKKKDPDNVAFAKKYVLDAIVKAGILANDGRKQIASLVDKFGVDEQPRVEVELREVS